MHWNSLNDFLAMGGSAGYVWGSFGAPALMLIGEPLLLARRRRALTARLRRQLAAEAREQSGERTPE